MNNLVRLLMPLNTRPNLGRSDRGLRLLCCFGLIILTLTINSHVDHPGSFALLSIFFYTTALIAWDPIYDFLGISTHVVAAPRPASTIEKVTQAGMTTPIKPLFINASHLKAAAGEDAGKAEESGFKSLHNSHCSVAAA